MQLPQARKLFFGREDTVDAIEIRVAVDPDQGGARRLKAPITQAAGFTALVADWTQRGQASYWGALGGRAQRHAADPDDARGDRRPELCRLQGLVMLVKNKGRDIAILRHHRRRAGLDPQRLASSWRAPPSARWARPHGCRHRAPSFRSISARSRASSNGPPGQAGFASDVYFLLAAAGQGRPRIEVAIIVGFSFAVSLLWTLPPASAGIAPRSGGGAPL